MHLHLSPDVHNEGRSEELITIYNKQMAYNENKRRIANGVLQFFVKQLKGVHNRPLNI